MDGQSIALGAVGKTIKLPWGDELKLAAMPASTELRFLDLLAKLAARANDVIGAVEALMGGAAGARVSLRELLAAVASQLGGSADHVRMLAEAVQIVIHAHHREARDKVTLQFLQDNLSIRDMITILREAAEVQGALAAFQGVLARLSPIPAPE